MERIVNNIRVLASDIVRKANSGHPGMAMGSAPMAYTLWAKHMNASAKYPEWDNRDRFVLSAGHASALYYSLLHLFGYDVTIDDLKQFRQLKSITPGHPEYGITPGIDASTGPLGQGIAMGVGMAIAEERLAAKFNKDGFNVVDHYTYVLSGDGCLQEGVSAEASSLAGHLKLNKLIVIYDDNGITIDGSTDITFTENVDERYRAYGWNVINVEDGNDLKALDLALAKAKEEKERPTLIHMKTKIAYGSLLEGSEKTHGNPLSPEDIIQLKEKFGFDPNQTFEVADDVKKGLSSHIERREKSKEDWDKMFVEYEKAYPQLAEEYKKWDKVELSSDILSIDKIKEVMNKTDATRNSGGIYMNLLSNYVPQLFGGSADLNGSTKTYLKDAKDFTRENRDGSNIFYGIREHAMGAICNGIALHKKLLPFCATFMVFSDYMKPTIRLSALMKLPVIYIYTHDSIGVGEDGPTHEPIEHLTMLRTIPNVNVYRPCDPRETAVAWNCAVTTTDAPSCIILSRQNLTLQDGVNEDAYKGAYVISKSKNEAEGILIGSGSEVDVLINAQKILEKEGIYVNVVSVLSKEIFRKQSKEYIDSVLPANLNKRVLMEAGISLGLIDYKTDKTAIIGIDTFGESAPGEILFKEFGFTAENVVDKYKNL